MVIERIIETTSKNTLKQIKINHALSGDVNSKSEIHCKDYFENIKHKKTEETLVVTIRVVHCEVET